MAPPDFLTVAPRIFQPVYAPGSVHTHFLKICLQLTVINDVRFREFKNNLSDFDKGAKQLMDD